MAIHRIRKKIFSRNIVALGNPKAWIINVKDFNNYVHDITQYLSNEELKKSEEIRFEKAKVLYCLRKGITRIILSNFLNINPDEVKYGYTANGKPFISNSECKNFSFNISHSKGYLFVGIVKKGDIGVDIEKVNQKLDCGLLTQSVFSAEEMALYSSYDKESQMRAFYKAWVQKEAISKALGLGLSMGFNNLTVNIDPNSNNENYSLKLDDIKDPFKMSVKFEDDYFLATALV